MSDNTIGRNPSDVGMAPGPVKIVREFKGAVQADESGAAPTAQLVQSLIDERRKLEEYLKERDEASRSDSPVQHPLDALFGDAAFPRNRPFISADQQRRIDEIAIETHGRGQDDILATLEGEGLHPLQLIETAKWFVTRDGAFLDRAGEWIDGAAVDQRV